MINVILQSLGLDLVNINVYANVYQIFQIIQELWTFFRKLSRTVRDRTSVIIRHTESQPPTSLSVDFLRVVQYRCLTVVLSWNH